MIAFLNFCNPAILFVPNASAYVWQYSRINSRSR
jgi:hypothetical protein